MFSVAGTTDDALGIIPAPRLHLSDTSIKLIPAHLALLREGNAEPVWQRRESRHEEQQLLSRVSVSRSPLSSTSVGTNEADCCYIE